jgi:hypothetical protein
VSDNGGESMDAYHVDYAKVNIRFGFNCRLIFVFIDFLFYPKIARH